MHGTGGFHREYLEARMIDQLNRGTRVEHVLVQGAVLVIPGAARLELLEAGYPDIQFQVVERQDFGQMRQVVLARPALEVLDEVCERRDRPPVIERAFFVR